MIKDINYKISIAGIGGQHVLTLTTIIAKAAVAAGLNVTAFTRLRSAMRLGPVLCDIRINSDKGFFPTISTGTADVVIGLEPYEGGIIASQLIRSNGYVLINIAQTPPINCIFSGEPYPDMNPIWTKARESGVNLIFLDASNLAQTIPGSKEGANIVLLGVLSKRVKEFPISISILRKTIGENEMSLRCFELGYQYQGS